MSDLLFVSVIIPTYRCWDDLIKCLVALENQSYPKHCYEVIVINNDPSDPPKVSLGNVILDTEAAPGSYAARNKGLRVARGSVIAFTDSDCIPHPDWLREAVGLLQSSSEVRIAGKIVVTSDTEKLSAVEAYQKALSFNQEKNASRGRSVTANMICKREVFERVGIFDTNLLSGGDWDWSRRASEAGIGIVFGAYVIVYHPARSSWHQLLKKSRRINSTENRRVSMPLSVLKFIVILLKIFIPPVNRAREIFLNPELNPSEKIKAWWVCYLLKIHGHGIRALCHLGVLRPSRS